ncbi:hypothetical protein KCE64_004873 [Salmonella enterica subsp. enterica serovar Hvittingfoss]|nr:hypothetical protein [Salmonella enterica subsp. enterica serovar Hvittingfoss]EHL2852364.1 hypothetical protein [Salmonella enterica subsp. enterica serovar Hvittingfoss]
MIDKKIIRGFSLPAVRECFRQTAKSTRRKSNRIHQLLNSSRYARNYGYMTTLNRTTTQTHSAKFFAPAAAAGGLYGHFDHAAPALARFVLLPVTIRRAAVASLYATA